METFEPVSSKLLLFGEYSILAGASAITLPLHDYSARLVLPDSVDGTDIESNEVLKKYIHYLEENDDLKEHIDIERLHSLIDEGLYLQSNIPQGYGLGSSASLCVAIYKSFGLTKLDHLLELKELYALMESYFHGKSSGLDPLTIHANRILYANSAQVECLPENYDLFEEGMYVYLLNSNIRRNAAQLITTFRNLLDEEEYKTEFSLKYLPLLEKVVADIKVKSQVLWADLLEFSKMQFIFFQKMIPGSIYRVWEQSLSTGEICFKLLGAGGGGFFLVFSREKLNRLEEFNLIPILNT
jgi:mevalonate kinase